MSSNLADFKGYQLFLVVLFFGETCLVNAGRRKQGKQILFISIICPNVTFSILVIPVDLSCPEDHYQCRNPEQCVAFENLCTIDWNFGTISQNPSHRCYDQLYCKQGVCFKVFT